MGIEFYIPGKDGRGLELDFTSHSLRHTDISRHRSSLSGSLRLRITDLLLHLHMALSQIKHLYPHNKNKMNKNKSSMKLKFQKLNIQKIFYEIYKSIN